MPSMNIPITKPPTLADLETILNGLLQNYPARHDFSVDLQRAWDVVGIAQQAGLKLTTSEVSHLGDLLSSWSAVQPAAPIIGQAIVDACRKAAELGLTLDLWISSSSAYTTVVPAITYSANQVTVVFFTPAPVDVPPGPRYFEPVITLAYDAKGEIKTSDYSKPGPRA